MGELTGHAEAVTAVKWCEWRELWVTASNDRDCPDCGVARARDDAVLEVQGDFDHGDGAGRFKWGRYSPQ